MNRTIRDISVENNAYKAERQSMLELFRMDTAQLTEFIRLARQKELTMEQTETLLGLLNPETRQKLTDAITENIRAKTIELAQLEEKIPGLTPAEKEVCICILQRKKPRYDRKGARKKALPTSRTYAAGYAASSISNTTRISKAVSKKSYTGNKRSPTEETRRADKNAPPESRRSSGPMQGETSAHAPL